MMVIMHIILVNAPVPTPLIVDCSSNESYRTIPRCPDAFPASFINLSCLLGLYSVSPLADLCEQFGLAI